MTSRRGYDNDRVLPWWGWLIIVLVVLGAFGALIGAATSTWASVPPNEIGLHYTGGPIQGIHFKSIIQPGTGTHYYGQLENIWTLPITNRNYIIDGSPERGDTKTIDHVDGVSNENVTFRYEAAVFFQLNRDKDTIKSFFESICMHPDLHHCEDSGSGSGWQKMLDQYFRPQIENAVRLEAGKFSTQELYKDPQVLVRMQNEIGSALKTEINSKLGGEFVCGPDSAPGDCKDLQFLLKNPTPPQSVVDAYNNSAAALQNVVTAQNDAQAKVKAAEGERDAANTRAAATALSPQQIELIQAQAELACAGNPQCTLVVVNGSNPGAVNVNTGK